MIAKLCRFLAPALLFISHLTSGQSTKQLQNGWLHLVHDEDEKAMADFSDCYLNAKASKNLALTAESALYLGMASYGASPSRGLGFALESLHAYEKLSASDALASQIGRGRSLQLIATIYARQDNAAEGLKLSRKALALLKAASDTSGSAGLAHLSIGRFYERSANADSALFHYKAALRDFGMRHKAYLPGAHIRIGKLLSKMNPSAAMAHYKKALEVSRATANRQAMVSSLIAMGNAFALQPSGIDAGYSHISEAMTISKQLTDRQFEVSAVEAMVDLKAKSGKLQEALELQKKLLALKDREHSAESEEIVHKLEVQFKLAERERELALLEKEKQVARLTNGMLTGAVVVLVALIAFASIFIRRLRRKDAQLLEARHALVLSLESEKNVRERQHAQEIAHKESQLSAVTLQIQRKNQFLEQLREAAGDNGSIRSAELHRLVSRHFSQGIEWQEFDTHFESLNGQFYTRLRERYAAINPNDLKLCALIRLNLSIKETADILNISPDSVKKARYRLRQKLSLSTEDNLADFLLRL